jgi:hypothetical protein
VPGIAGREDDSLVNDVDLAPTLAEFSGAAFFTIERHQSCRFNQRPLAPGPAKPIQNTSVRQ